MITKTEGKKIAALRVLFSALAYQSNRPEDPNLFSTMLVLNTATISVIQDFKIAPCGTIDGEMEFGYSASLQGNR